MLNYDAPRPAAFVGANQIHRFFKRYCTILDDAAVTAAGYDPTDVAPDEHYYRLDRCPPSTITLPGVTGRYDFKAQWSVGDVIHQDWCI